MGTKDFTQVRGRKMTPNIIKLKEMKLTNTVFMHIPPQRSNEDEDIQAHMEISRKLFNRTLDKHFETIAILVLIVNWQESRLSITPMIRFRLRGSNSVFLQI